MGSTSKIATEYGISGVVVVALYGTFVIWAEALPPIPDAWMLPLLGGYAATLQAGFRAALAVGRWWKVFPPEAASE